jgi:putative tryptophan/tyrosine transport system substrate-binding protein
MTRWLRCWLLGLLLVFAAAAGMAAGPGVLIVREDNALSRQAAEVLGRELTSAGWNFGEAVVNGERSIAPGSDNKQVLVAFGSRAFVAATKHAAGRSVVAAMITQPALDDLPPVTAERWSAIVLDQPLDRWLNLIQIAFPGSQQVGMLVSPAGQRAVRSLERKMADRRLNLATESLAASDDVVPALEHLLPRMNLLLALPDQVVHNRNTVQPLLLTTYRAGIPVLAYSESYQQAGAVLALYSTVPQVIAQVMDTLRQFQDGRPPANVQSPRYFTVAVNAAVARSLGLSLPTGAELTSRLSSLGQ